ncbi:hypothetical protein CBLAS_1124 [Campylobacter blaseri]|uniref:Septum formation initiator n=1 Tax=Campylobacter blaseri TaxID=2042961 RepID=A0A2P8QZM6_9BACT|nr:hypothetical protein [Campylobacter blaseri]PSM51703.1 hypothetical protein CQ405_06100 [Campylobacter blaseri]PSM53493.1 hypothetical protein CRN67_06100 [Campylobacter blaseri]QKF86298.1 hypothetical protein CBLAS_1124 [Campylobacter blaseri]
MKQDEILENYENRYKQEKNLSFYDLLIAYIIVAVFVVLFVPAIYIRNEIYYISRDIHKLKNKHSILLEENDDLKYRLKRLQFENEIILPLKIKIDD